MLGRAPVYAGAQQTMTITLSDIALARYRLSTHLTPTPLEPASGLGNHIWLKLENANKTHSFKIRGAINAMLALDNRARGRGIVTASSGNHAQGIACAANLLGMRARIVMARNTAERKVRGVIRWGSEPLLFGEGYTEAEAEALRVRDAIGAIYISPYNDPNVIAGQGTIGLEILDALPDVERVIVPTSGGGLISGVALALKAIKPSVEVIGVNLERSPAMYNAFYGEQLPVYEDSLADALPGEIEQGSITIDIVRERVDGIVLVSEEAVAQAMR
ncbi:MAG: threonine/serine dehydratase, partial [Anaerolineae bacterium]|nr:threonine/serine dehydratase [Anaerolineae bacterium]